ncbi:hypothetical protein [Sabulibacter ruber]|uniref:hypothetical protein n=1 Tax=Sabulibacter ruber TaxID=2811901 RepID=UPI001A962270|nr:hypothetical protein [Sabulibacter ruber]
MQLTCQTLPYTNVYVDNTLRVVHVEYEGFVPSSVYRKTILWVLELIKTSNLEACVYDIRKLKSLQPQDQDWLIDEILPMLKKTPMRKLAVLESKSELGQLNLSQLVYYTPFSFELQYFEDAESALEWIKQSQTADNLSATSRKIESMPLA